MGARTLATAFSVRVPVR